MSTSTAPAPGMSLAKFLAGLDWQALLFVALIGLATLYLIRLDRDPSTPFRLVHFITDRDGVGNSASLAYVVALLVSTWAMFYLTTRNRLEDWFFGAYIGVFVAGGVVRAHIGSRERAARQHATPPVPPSPPAGPDAEPPP